MQHFAIMTLISLLFLNPALGSIEHHIVIKNDLNKDGVADRVAFASHGISGFFQSTLANSKIDTFQIKQGNRTIFYTSSKSVGGPYIKLTESSGFFSVVSLLKYENRNFKLVSSFVTPSKTFFSDDFLDGATIVSTEAPEKCVPANEFNHVALNEASDWTKKLEKHTVEEAIKKAIDPECKKVFGDKYSNLETQIVSACSVSSGMSNSNALVTCLDKNEQTRNIGGFYQQTLVSTLFDSNFKISCGLLKTDKPRESVNSVSNIISIFQTTPKTNNRNFKADFFHAVLHLGGIEDDKKVSTIVDNCMRVKTKNQPKADDRYYANPTTFSEETIKKKDGVELTIPSQHQQINQTTVASTINESAKTLDTNYAMENDTQYKSLTTVSRATFKSFEPLMSAAYNAAIPAAFAQNTVISATNGSAASVAIGLPTTKATTSARSIASTSPASAVSGVIYDVSSLPESVSASDKGDLGNGLTVKASAVAFNEVNSRAPAATGSSEAATARGASGSGSIAGRLASIKTTDRPDLRNNVPQLKLEEDFIKTLTTGKYAEVKAKLIDPRNEEILKEKQIQYVARDKTLGSKQPAVIIKDLGNAFTVLRVNVQ